MWKYIVVVASTIALSLVSFLFLKNDNAKPAEVESHENAYGADEQKDNTEIDEFWSRPIDSDLCNTIISCRDLGDKYGEEYLEIYQKGMEDSNQLWYLEVGIDSDKYMDINNNEDNILASYELTNNELVLLKGNEENRLYQDVGDLVKELYSLELAEFKILNFWKGGYPRANAEGILFLPDYLFSEHQRSMVTILIHEYAHLVTLKDSQYKTTDICSSNQYHIISRQMCFNEDSYMNQYYQAFLSNKNGDWLDWGYNNLENRQSFYEEFKDDFISTYATTNPIEDIAESFKNFVFQPYKEPKTIADKKVNFFYQFEELVQYRTFVLKTLKDRKDEMDSFY